MFMFIAMALFPVSFTVFVLTPYVRYQALKCCKDDPARAAFLLSFEELLSGIASIGLSASAFFSVFPERADAVSDMLAFVAALVVFVIVRGIIELWRYLIKRHFNQPSLREELRESQRRCRQRLKRLAEELLISECSNQKPLL